MILFAIVQPYKSMYKVYNTVTVVIFGVLVMVTVGIVNVNIALIKVHQSVNFSAAVTGILIALPQFYALTIGFKWIYKQRIFKRLQTLFKFRGSMDKSLSESSLLIASDHRAKSHKLLT